MAVEKKSTPMTLDEMKQLLSTMREAGVRTFTYNGLSAEFDPHHVEGKPTQPPTTIDDKAEAAEQLRALLKEAAADEDLNLAWST